MTDVISDAIWKKQGDHASIPRYTVQSDYDYNWRNDNRWDNGIGNKNGSNSSFYFSKGDFLAFREISFSYHLETSFLKKAYIQGLDIFAGAYNIGYLTRYQGLMPEIYTGDDPGLYPRPLEYNFGINVHF
jgi:hypothetical protein